MRKKHLVKKQVVKLITPQMNLILLLQFHVKPETKKKAFIRRMSPSKFLPQKPPNCEGVNLKWMNLFP